MKELLQRYIKGEVSEKERLKIASWLDESPENMREFLVLRKLYDISLWQANTDKTNSVKKVHYSIRKVRPRLKNRSHLSNQGFWEANNCRYNNEQETNANHSCPCRTTGRGHLSRWYACMAKLSLNPKIS